MLFLWGNEPVDKKENRGLTISVPPHGHILFYGCNTTCSTVICSWYKVVIVISGWLLLTTWYLFGAKASVGTMMFGGPCISEVVRRNEADVIFEPVYGMAMKSFPHKVLISVVLVWLNPSETNGRTRVSFVMKIQIKLHRVTHVVTGDLISKLIPLVDMIISSKCAAILIVCTINRENLKGLSEWVIRLWLIQPA